MRGNKIPLPKQLFRTLLTAVLPRVVARKLAALLPPEFGSYLLRINDPSSVCAQLSLVGPPLAVFDADLTTCVAGDGVCTLLEMQPAQVHALGGLIKTLHTNVPATLRALLSLHERYAQLESLRGALLGIWDEAAAVIARLCGTVLPPATELFGKLGRLAKKPLLAR